MPWGRCDDSFYDHAKVRALRSDIRLAACGLYWRAISFCNRQLNDGKLTEADVAFLDGTSRLTDELVRVRLWDRRPGLRVHDYLRFNKSKAEVLKERRTKAEAGRAGGLASGRTRAKQTPSNGQALASSVVEPPSRPVPTRPDPVDIGRTSPPDLFSARAARPGGRPERSAS